MSKNPLKSTSLEASRVVVRNSNRFDNVKHIKFFWIEHFNIKSKCTQAKTNEHVSIKIDVIFPRWLIPDTRVSCCSEDFTIEM